MHACINGKTLIIDKTEILFRPYVERCNSLNDDEEEDEVVEEERRRSGGGVHFWREREE